MRTGAPPRQDTWRTGAPADDTLVEVARAGLTGAEPAAGGVRGDWTAAFDGFWCTVRPPGDSPAPPAPGWRIHVSAADTVAAEVLASVAEVLAEDPCGFRFAADRARLHEINSGDGERGSAGKFITVEPLDEAQFRRLLPELHRATEGLPGPALLAERAFAPGSRVHYQCPPWVVDPVEGRGSAGAGSARGGEVLLGGRYALTAAVRHSADGGVFLGTDTTDGRTVLVKQATTQFEMDRAGADPHPALHHEARLLAELAPLGLTARPLALITQGDSLLLVQEHIPGQTLDSWVAARLSRDGAPDVPWEAARPMALALVELLGAVHAAGLVLRDLSPSKVLVLPDGSLRLADLELACATGVVAGPAGADGYRAPEQSNACPAADPAADLFALGGLFFLLATGHDPVLPEGLPLARPLPERLGRWLALAAREGGTAARLAPLVLGLRAAAAGQRWPLERVRAALTAADPSGSEEPDESEASEASEASDQPTAGGVRPQPLARVLQDGLRHLAVTATPRRPDRLWPAAPGGQHTDPCTGQHGAAGPLAVLARALGTLPELELTVRQAASWVERRCASEPVVPPGLHCGRSGVAWALLDAAEALGDEALAARARRLARPIPPRWPSPDVCHGAAGAGFLRLRLGEPEAALRVARPLLAAAEQGPYGTVWPVPETFDSGLAGRTHLDYRHGVAGIGAFLLAVHRATGDAEALAGARQAAATLAATVRRHGAGAWWPRSADDPDSVPGAHWCGASSGVGGFLVRLWRTTGEPAHGELAVAAGQAVLDRHRPGGPGGCHGPAGDGEYLLDLAEATGEARFRRGAEELADLLAARAVLRDGLLVLPEEGGTDCAAGYGTTTAGGLAFLLRLLHGGPRLWVDPVAGA
ncbi:class IV lanthionine synthetase LanL [Kitasatospora azatica]|uniref:class IV lanthionine synthetase LanL n=1 Tax=Kitasatospora azatica TaxID=58347 RepID=UPI00055DC2D1|nr:class IV lanthionine synthetase LanL [Kitasatospora azatica]